MGFRGRNTSTVVRHAALIAAIVLAALGVTYALTYDRAPEVAVGWREGVGTDRRHQLERRFGLVRPRHEINRRVSYDLADTRSSNIRALVEHVDVEDTHDIDRHTFTVPADSPYGVGRSWIGNRLPGLRVYWVVPSLIGGSVCVLAGSLMTGAYRRRKRLRRFFRLALGGRHGRLERPRQRFAGGGDVRA